MTGPSRSGQATETGRPVERAVLLAHGRRLVVRPVEPDDIEGLAALYAGLDDDSRYRRFFSLYRPDREFFERLVAIADRGGAGLVATVTDHDGERTKIIADAGYELLPDGDGELAITVDHAWRGWLGPYLLDVLVDVAAAHDVPDIEAEVLATNGPMLAVLRSRGWAAMPEDDWSVMRAVIGTMGRIPRWPPVADGVRVLVEGAGGHWHDHGGVGAAGLEVLCCPGPGARSQRCPALAGEPCPLAAGADVIVVHHPADTAAWRTLRETHPQLHPGVPVCVELADGDGDGDDSELLAAVRRLGRSGAAPPTTGA